MKKPALKSVTVSVKGDFAYGYLQSEEGVHRLVRLSPFDSARRRHTSFAKVELWPDIQSDIEIEVEDKDIRIDTYPASGAGGQHVQKNDTAVRITHLPPSIVVQCQNQRSQAQNRDRAMQILKARLFEMERARQEAEMALLKGENVDAGWGNQIRSYVLHPYQMVKDHRTSVEIGNTTAVLDGRLDEFIEAYSAPQNQRLIDRRLRSERLYPDRPPNRETIRPEYGTLIPTLYAKVCPHAVDHKHLFPRLGIAA